MPTKESLVDTVSSAMTIYRDDIEKRKEILEAYQNILKEVEKNITVVNKEDTSVVVSSTYSIKNNIVPKDYVNMNALTKVNNNEQNLVKNDYSKVEMPNVYQTNNYNLNDYALNKKLTWEELIMLCRDYLDKNLPENFNLEYKYSNSYYLGSIAIVFSEDSLLPIVSHYDVKFFDKNSFCFLDMISRRRVGNSIYDSESVDDSFLSKQNHFNSDTKMCVPLISLLPPRCLSDYPLNVEQMRMILELLDQLTIQIRLRGFWPDNNLEYIYKRIKNR